MRLRAVVGRLRKYARERKPQTIVWSDLTLERVRRVSERPGLAINKLGRVVLRGELRGAPVKIYEAFSSEHARFIEAVSALPALRTAFPEIIARRDRWIVARWVDGESPPAELLSPVVELQARLHGVAAAELPPAGFELWRDFLRPRFTRAASLIGVDHDRELALVDAEIGSREAVLSHPDLRPANLIQHNELLISIDNESCATTTLPLLDVAHTVRAVGDHGARFWRLYLDRTGHAPTETTRIAVNAAWVARLVGTAFVEGRIADARRVFQEYRSGRKLLPF